MVSVWQGISNARVYIDMCIAIHALCLLPPGGDPGVYRHSSILYLNSYHVRGGVCVATGLMFGHLDVIDDKVGAH